MSYSVTECDSVMLRKYVLMIVIKKKALFVPHPMASERREGQNEIAIRVWKVQSSRRTAAPAGDRGGWAEGRLPRARQGQTGGHHRPGAAGLGWSPGSRGVRNGAARMRRGHDGGASASGTALLPHTRACHGQVCTPLVGEDNSQ